MRSALFGLDYAQRAGIPDTCIGVISKWKKAKTNLYILFDGDARNSDTPLSSLDKDSVGNSLGLELLDYEDGRPAPPPLRGARKGKAEA